MVFDKAVVALPARNSGCLSTFKVKPMLVLTPRMRVSRNDRVSLSMADSYVSALAVTFVSIES